ncbi:hypothetical protein MCOR01_010414 [Pyricularia oryzae]|nr:hypothetical protein MCOR01_010414 [Pyricularia oryzae]
MSSQSAAGKITDWVKPGDTSGEFKRQVSSFRNWVSSEAGAQFPAEKGRYHLYVSYACPWATRVLIARKLKGLEDVISFSSVHWHLGENGWRSPRPRRRPTRTAKTSRRTPAPGTRRLRTSGRCTLRRSPSTRAASRCRCCGTRCKRRL